MRSDSTVLLVSSDPEETIVFERILGEHMVLKRVQDLPELQDVLEDDTHYDVVLCGWTIRKGTWKDALRQVLQRRPRLPVIIFCRTGTEREWVEVLGAGAFDLLPTPYLERTVLPVLEHAVTSYRARRLRDGLQPRYSQRQAGQGEFGAGGVTIATIRVRGGMRGENTAAL